MHIQRSVSAVVLGLLLFPVCAFSQITVSPRAGGVTNTGNAAVGDVASGKTFSSSVLTNATGTSTKDATVGGSAPIQPPQAFVDSISQFVGSGTSRNIICSNKGITTITLSSATFTVWRDTIDHPNIDLSSNALNTASVDDALTVIVGLTNTNDAGTLNVSGGTSSTPTGGAINDNAWDAAFIGWTVKFNLHSHTVSFYEDQLTFDFSGNSMSASEVNALLAFVVAEYPVFSLVLNISGGTNAAPTGQGITDKNTLIAAGWTVTVNP